MLTSALKMQVRHFPHSVSHSYIPVVTSLNMPNGEAGSRGARECESREAPDVEKIFLFASDT